MPETYQGRWRLGARSLWKSLLSSASFSLLLLPALRVCDPLVTGSLTAFLDLFLPLLTA